MKSLLETTNTPLKTQREILKDFKGIREEQMAMTKTHEPDYQEKLRVLNWFRDKDTLAAATRNRVEIARVFAELCSVEHIKVAVLDEADLETMLDKNFKALKSMKFASNVLDAFPVVDLALRVTEREDSSGLEFYVVVEASYTGTSDDIERAVVRAKILGAITGQDTYAVVASVHLGEGTEGRVVGDAEEYLASADGNIAFWYEIVEEEVWPP